MTSIDRRAFLGFGYSTAVMTGMSLTACGGGGAGGVGSDYSAVTSQNILSEAITTEGVQFRTVAKSHTLMVRQLGGSEAAVGGVGFGLGKLNAPEGVAVMGGLAYVVEKGNHRVQVFDATGKPVRTFGEGTLLYPGGIAAGSEEIFV